MMMGVPPPASKLAPSLAADPAAINEWLNALERHAGDIDAWFVHQPPQFSMRPRFPVVQRLLQQVKDFDRLVNAAIAVVSVTENTVLTVIGGRCWPRRSRTGAASSRRRPNAGSSTPW